MSKTLPFSKLKVPLDEEETKNFAWEKKFSTQPKSGKKVLAEEESEMQESANQSS